jgi:hypothetical protein
MVIRYQKVFSALILSILFFTLTTIFVGPSQAVTYVINKELAVLWINKDLSIDIRYNITITYLSSAQGIVTLGLPKKGYRIESVKDLLGNDLNFDSLTNFVGIDVYLTQPIVPNQPNTFIVYAVVPNMVHSDDTNQGNAGMDFYPSPFDGANGPIGYLGVAIVLPEGVTQNEIKYLTGVPFDDVSLVGNNFVVYWQRTNFPSSQEFWVGVSFPGKYVNLNSILWQYLLVGGIFTVGIIFLVFFLIKNRKKPYEKPRVALEALGAMRNLTAVEAAIVLNSKVVRVLTMVLFGLLLKRLVTVIETDPLIKLQKTKKIVSKPTKNLRYYEIEFLRTIKKDGTLNEVKLARTFLELKETVNLKLRGYSRSDTANYYRSILKKAWNQVKQAGTPTKGCFSIKHNFLPTTRVGLVLGRTTFSFRPNSRSYFNNHHQTNTCTRICK